MDMMTMLMFMMMMDDSSSQETTSPTNENDIWTTLIMTLPDILGAFGFGS